jgi:hypothetical protein
MLFPSFINAWLAVSFLNGKTASGSLSATALSLPEPRFRELRLIIEWLVGKSSFDSDSIGNGSYQQSKFGLILSTDRAVHRDSSRAVRIEDMRILSKCLANRLDYRKIAEAFDHGTATANAFPVPIYRDPSGLIETAWRFNKINFPSLVLLPPVFLFQEAQPQK